MLHSGPYLRFNWWSGEIAVSIITAIFERCSARIWKRK